MPAVSLTDHGSMAGAVELYRLAGKAGIQPIIGCEVYLVEDRRAKEPPNQRNWAHLTLLAETTAGYHNLVKLVSFGYLEGFHYKPRVDFELLERYAGGLIALSGCLASRVNQALLEDDYGRARGPSSTGWCRSSGATRCTSSCRTPASRSTRRSTRGCCSSPTRPACRWSARATCTTCAPRTPTRTRCCSASRRATSSRTRGASASPTRSSTSRRPDEMARVFAAVRPRAACGRRWRSPSAATSSSSSTASGCRASTCRTTRTPRAYLRRLCEEGLQRRYEVVDDALRNRLAFELQTIREMGFADYFLIVWDFVAFAKREGVGVGPGRGSAAGSLVAYCLGITDVDPIRYDLLFERFLNPGRKSMPDIDIDFSVHGRERVMEYVVAKYGRERVAQIITFGKLAAKAATRDVGRVLGLPFATVDRIAKFIPEGVKVGFDDCMKPGQELQSAYDDPTAIGRTADGRDVAARDLIDMARPLEGLIRQDGIHAAAVVIGDRPLVEYLPLQRKGADKELVTQYAMGDVERARPAQDGLPGPAQPRRHRRGRAAHRGVDRRATSTWRPAARRRADLRDAARAATRWASSSSSRAACARRCARCARRSSTTSSRSSRCTGPARWRTSRCTRGARTAHEPVTYTDTALEPILGAHAGRVHLPGAGDADRQGPGRLLARPGRRPAQGHRQEERRADGLAQGRRSSTGCVGNGVERKVAEHALGRERALAPTTPSTRPTPPATRSIAYRTAYLKANHPGRVHGGAHLLGHGDEGQGAVLRPGVRRDGHRGAAAGRQPLRARLRGASTARSASA